MSRLVWSLDAIEARARALGATVSVESGEFHKRWLHIRLRGDNSIDGGVSAFPDGTHMFNVSVFGDMPSGLIARATALESFWKELVDGLPKEVEPEVVEPPVPAEPEVFF